jgi:putative ABC transport system permease protein
VRGAVTAQLALASLRHRPLRTGLTALGIAIAIASTVVFMSIGEGLRKAFADQLAGLGPDIQVSFGEVGDDLFPTAPDLPAEYVERLRADAERFGIRSVTPALLYLRGGLSPSQSFVFEGLPTDVPLNEVFTGASVVEGRLLTPEDEEALVAVVGRSVASRARLEVGDELRLNPDATFEVVGVVSSDAGLLENLVIVPFASLREAMGVEDRVSTIMVKLEDPARADRVAEEIEAAYPDLGAQTQAGAMSVVQDSLRISDFVRLGISAIALVVGAIAVANTMMMSVFERTREFGVVRAVGARPTFLFSIVVLESVVLSLVGAAVGVGLGTLATRVVNAIANDYVGLSVAAVTPRLVAFAVLVAAATGLLAGLLPAGRAARVPIAVAVARE